MRSTLKMSAQVGTVEELTSIFAKGSFDTLTFKLRIEATLARDIETGEGQTFEVLQVGMEVMA